MLVALPAVPALVQLTLLLQWNDFSQNNLYFPSYPKAALHPLNCNRETFYCQWPVLLLEISDSSVTSIPISSGPQYLPAVLWCTYTEPFSLHKTAHAPPLSGTHGFRYFLVGQAMEVLPVLSSTVDMATLWLYPALSDQVQFCVHFNGLYFCVIVIICGKAGGKSKGKSCEVAQSQQSTVVSLRPVRAMTGTKSGRQSPSNLVINDNWLSVPDGGGLPPFHTGCKSLEL